MTLQPNMADRDLDEELAGRDVEEAINDVAVPPSIEVVLMGGAVSLTKA
jgi:hypothetical protein